MAFFPIPFHLPPLEGPFAAFWTAARARRLVVQRCADCGAWRHPPGAVCWRCRSANAAFEPVSGRGTILSYTVVHQELVPELAGAGPYNVIVVELQDIPDVHIISNLVGTANEAIAVGLPVEVIFEDVDDTVTLPRFRLAGGV
jgi:uncharacterized OB-fold protein